MLILFNIFTIFDNLNIDNHRKTKKFILSKKEEKMNYEQINRFFFS